MGRVAGGVVRVEARVGARAGRVAWVTAEGATAVVAALSSIRRIERDTYRQIGVSGLE